MAARGGGLGTRLSRRADHVQPTDAELADLVSCYVRLSRPLQQHTLAVLRHLTRGTPKPRTRARRPAPPMLTRLRRAS